MQGRDDQTISLPTPAVDALRSLGVLYHCVRGSCGNSQTDIHCSRGGSTAPGGGTPAAGRAGSARAFAESPIAPAREGGRPYSRARDGESNSRSANAASVPPAPGASESLATSGTSSGTGVAAPLCRPSRTLAFLGLAAALLVLILAATGCGAKAPAAVVTRFAPPTTAPSVTPAVLAIRASNDAASKQAGDARSRAAGLTPENLPTEKPVLIGELDQLVITIGDVADRLATAAATAAANDADVKRMAAERDEARRLVSQREAELAVRTKERDEARESAFKWIWGTCVLAGLAGVFIGLVIVFKSSHADVGFIVAGGGAVAICLGLAGSRYGKELAIAGLAILAVVVVGGVWAVIERLKGDGVSIAEGVEHAADAGVIDLSKAAKFFRTAQTAGAAALVKQVKTEGKGS